MLRLQSGKLRPSFVARPHVFFDTKLDVLCRTALSVLPRDRLHLATFQGGSPGMLGSAPRRVGPEPGSLHYSCSNGESPY